jgi:hypothetical protein
MISKYDMEQIEKNVAFLVGRSTWGVELGIGSFVTMNWGESLPSDQDGFVYGEWYMWLYCCGWRIEQTHSIIVGSYDSPAVIEESIQNLEGKKVISVELSPNLGDLVLTFENELVLKVFNESSQAASAWMLFTPEKHVIKAGPGSLWSYTPAEES